MFELIKSQVNPINLINNYKISFKISNNQAAQ